MPYPTHPSLLFPIQPCPTLTYPNLSYSIPPHPLWPIFNCIRTFDPSGKWPFRHLTPRNLLYFNVGRYAFLRVWGKASWTQATPIESSVKVKIIKVKHGTRTWNQWRSIVGATSGAAEHAVSVRVMYKIHASRGVSDTCLITTRYYTIRLSTGRQNDVHRRWHVTRSA